MSVGTENDRFGISPESIVVSGGNQILRQTATFCQTLAIHFKTRFQIVKGSHSLWCSRHETTGRVWFRLVFVETASCKLEEPGLHIAIFPTTSIMPFGINSSKVVSVYPGPGGEYCDRCRPSGVFCFGGDSRRSGEAGLGGVNTRAGSSTAGGDPRLSV
jgi:hypothetical protein